MLKKGMGRNVVLSSGEVNELYVWTKDNRENGAMRDAK